MLVFSVGGGSIEKNVSVNIVKALETATSAGAHVFGIVGRDGGFTHQVSETCVVIPTARSGAYHAPHRRALRGDMASAGQPSTTAARCHQVGVRTMMDRRFFLAGGAGFIGSHFTDRLLSSQGVEVVTLFDNFSSGREWHYAHHQGDPRLRVIHGDVKDLAALDARPWPGHDVVIHLASNPDIARAVTEPDIDFREGTFLTQQILEAMRRSGTQRLLYASGSGVYGDLGEREASEDFGPLVPVSTYGASKLAGEALIASYCAMFGIRACAFRFGNVVGRRQTHGVGFDFVSASAAAARPLAGAGGWPAKQILYLRRGCCGSSPARASEYLEKFRSVQCRHRRLHHRHRDRPVGDGGIRALGRRSPASITRAETGVGKATYPWCA